MSEIKFKLAAIELLERKKSLLKNNRLKAEIRPESIEDALRIQEEIIAISPKKIIGWKCLLPSADGKIFVAPIIANNIQSGQVCVLKGDNNQALIEPEIAFVLGKDIIAQDHDYSEEEINLAVSKTHLALELIHKRFDENKHPSFFEKLADSLNNQALFLGPEISLEKAFKTENLTINIKQNSTKQTFEGKHLNQFPQKPLYWMINYMSKRGVSFEKGQAIITGSYCGIINVEFDQPTEIEYENLATFELTFKEAS